MALWARTGRSKPIPILHRDPESSSLDEGFDEFAEHVLVSFIVPVRTAGKKAPLLEALSRLAAADLSALGKLSGTEQSAKDYAALQHAIEVEAGVSRQEARKRAEKTRKNDEAAWQRPRELLAALESLSALCRAKNDRTKLDAVLRKHGMGITRKQLVELTDDLIDRTERALAAKKTAVRLVIDPGWL